MFLIFFWFLSPGTLKIEFLAKKKVLWIDFSGPYLKINFIWVPRVPKEGVPGIPGESLGTQGGLPRDPRGPQGRWASRTRAQGPGPRGPKGVLETRVRAGPRTLTAYLFYMKTSIFYTTNDIYIYIYIYEKYYLLIKKIYFYIFNILGGLGAPGPGGPPFFRRGAWVAHYFIYYSKIWKVSIFENQMFKEGVFCHQLASYILEDLDLRKHYLW